MPIPVTLFITAAAVRQLLSRLLLSMGPLLCSGAYAVAPDTQFDIGILFDDNVTRANDGGTRLADRSYSVNLSQPAIFPIAEHQRVVLTGSLDGEMFERNTGLNRLSGAVHGELQYRSSAEFGTPTFGLFAKVAADQYQSYLRDGFRYAAGVSLRQTLTDRIRLFGTVAHNERTGNNAVFDNRDNAARIDLDYSLGSAGTIYLGGEYRRGDLVISGSELWSGNNPNAYTQDDAFSSTQVYSFRFDGATVLSTLGYNLALGARNAVDIAWRRASSSVSYMTPAWSNATLNYVTNQYSLVYLLRF
jgi:hypothetical protein